MADGTKVDDAKIERRRRWSVSMIKMAADIAKEKGVTVRLEADGAITVSPPIATDVTEEEDGLEKW